MEIATAFGLAMTDSYARCRPPSRALRRINADNG